MFRDWDCLCQWFNTEFTEGIIIISQLGRNHMDLYFLLRGPNLDFINYKWKCTRMSEFSSNYSMGCHTIEP